VLIQTFGSVSQKLLLTILCKHKSCKNQIISTVEVAKKPRMRGFFYVYSKQKVTVFGSSPIIVI
jgi:serine kinase of HPr protein (carbohydrate metabolism regulator)